MKSYDFYLCLQYRAVISCSFLILRSIKHILPDDFKLPNIAVIDFDKYNLKASAIGGFDKSSGYMFINSKYNTKEKIIKFVNKQADWFANKTEYAPYLHELGHKFYEDCIILLATQESLGYNKAKDILDSRIAEYIHERNFDGEFVNTNISEYANKGYQKHKYTEIIAECFTVPENKVASEIIELLRRNFL